jgi:hypothetical protein
MEIDNSKDGQEIVSEADEREEQEFQREFSKA